jgi:hypothetical protein
MGLASIQVEVGQDDEQKGPPSFQGEPFFVTSAVLWPPRLPPLTVMLVIAISGSNLRFWLVAGETIVVCCEIRSGHAAALTGIGGLSTEVMGMVSAMEGE